MMQPVVRVPTLAGMPKAKQQKPQRLNQQYQFWFLLSVSGWGCNGFSKVVPKWT